MRTRLLASALGATLLLPALAAAQMVERLGPATRTGEPRFQGGITGMYGQPIHEFRTFVKQGWGLAGHGLFRLGGSGAAAIRLDAGWLNYGNETKRIPWNDNVGRVTVDLNTTNNIFLAGIGPQFMVPSGPLRPYVNGSVGFAVFSTTSSIRDRNTDTDIASDNNKTDGSWATAAGGGFLIPLSAGRRSMVFLDLGARYHNNGTLTYLKKGSITDLPGGGVRYNEIRSEANLWTYHVGVSIGGR